MGPKYRYWIDGKMQYWNKVNSRDMGTGVKDSDGREIYEGDIVQFTMEGEESEVTVVEFKQGSFRLAPSNYQIWAAEKEELLVLGNIHENPELLEEE